MILDSGLLFLGHPVFESKRLEEVLSWFRRKQGTFSDSPCVSDEHSIPLSAIAVVNCFADLSVVQRKYKIEGGK